MMRLPARIEVQLVDAKGSPVQAEGVLVGVDLKLDRRYYYGNILGLTDHLGRAGIDRAELELRMTADRVDFPMDYKVPFDECDPLIDVGLVPTDEIDNALSEANAPSLSEAMRVVYERATNRLYRRASVHVWADLPGSRLLRVLVPAIRG